jgi:tetratricopeptide (TPR) repeat protein
MAVISQNKLEEGDQNFEAALSRYIDAIVSAEKEGYQSTLQPFSIREQEIRRKVEETFHFFQKSFAKGYRILIEELKQEMEMSKSSGDLVALAKVDQEKLKIFGDTDALIKALEGGNSIYELLGFTEKSLSIFYHATFRLMENKEFERARDVCYFLVTIAPGVSQFWISIGRCDANLHIYETALLELSRAIELDPTESAGYLDLIDLFLEMHEFNSASELCDAGVQFALEHRQETWSDSLRATLEGKKSKIQIWSRNLRS